MAKVDDELFSLLRISSSHRSPDTIQQISDSVSGLKFFQELGDDALKACCKVMRGQLFRRHQIVFHYGDPGTSFYIILYGTVRVLVPLHPTGANRGVMYRKSVATDEEGRVLLREVALLKAGDCFGELALLQSESRTATIECKGMALLAKIFRDDYNRVLRLQQEKKLTQQIHFFKTTAAFSGFGDMQLAKLVYFFHEKHYLRNAVVYRKGDPSVSVFIIASGEFVFSDVKYVAVEVDKDTGVTRVKQRDVKLYSKGVHEMFGEEEVMQAAPRALTCTCASVNGQVFYMSKEEFMKWCQSEGTQKYLGRYRESQSAWLERRVPSLLSGENAKLSMSFTTLGKPKLSSPVPHKAQIKRLLVLTGAVGRLKRAEDEQKARLKSRGVRRSQSTAHSRVSMYAKEK